MKLFLFSLFSFISVIFSSKWIGLNIGECNQQNIQFSLLLQVGVCHNTPSSISLVRSYMISSCSNDNLFITTSLKLYTSKDCSGYSFDYNLDPMSSSCINGTSLICEDNPTALTENWPALGVYIDNMCSSPSIVVAAKPGCDSFEYQNQQYSSQVSCIDSTLSIDVYNTSLTCQGNPVIEDSMNINTCTNVSNFLTDLPENLPSQLEKLIELIDVTTLSYYSDCEGISSLPGIAENPNGDDDSPQDNTKSESGSNKSTKYGGLGIGGLSALLISIVAFMLVTFFITKRFMKTKKPEELQNII